MLVPLGRTIAQARSKDSTEARESKAVITILAGKMFDPYSLTFLINQEIRVCPETGLILSVKAFSNLDFNSIRAPTDINVIDLSALTVLPGFVDTHVHFFLHEYSETSWADQLTKEPLTERTVRAVNHARETILAGFTTVRDLGTEGAGDADIALRKCLSGPHPLIPGPRYFCSNRAILSAPCSVALTTNEVFTECVKRASHRNIPGPKGTININSEGVEGITGAEVADGVDECRRTVRRQIGAGADWIKIYADYRHRSRLADVAPIVAATTFSTFQEDELKTMIDTAHLLDTKVAVHSSTHTAVSKVVELGVDSLEHGSFLVEDSIFKQLANSNTIWNPTLSASWTIGGELWRHSSEGFKQGLKTGVKIACGGDTGVFRHGDNALEMQLMVKLGKDPMTVLRAATLGGWECIRSKRWEGTAGEERMKRVEELCESRAKVGDNEMPFGAIRTGFSADIIATDGDIEADFEEAVCAKHITFVMKTGKVYKCNGAPYF